MRRFILLLLLVSIGFSLFTETVRVQVVDGLHRIISNASVQITYQLDYTTSKGYVTIGPYYTNATGLVEVTFHNIEMYESRVDYDYVITVSYGNQQATKTVTYDKHADPITIELPVYFLTIMVVDQQNSRLEGAEVSYEDVTKVTDEDGKAKIRIGEGEADIEIKYGGIAKTEQLSIFSDTYKTVVIPLYNLEILVADEKGSPIVGADVTVGNEEYETNEEGEVVINDTGEITPSVSVEYRGKKKELDVNLELQEYYVVSYDYSPPNISNVWVEQVENIVLIYIEAEDEGMYASGIAPEGVSIKYYVGDEEFNTIGYLADGVYLVEIGGQQQGQTVYFFIEVIDNEGNKATREGSYVVGSTTVQENITNTTTDGQQEQEFEIPWMYILGVTGLLVVIFGVWKLKSIAKESV